MRKVISAVSSVIVAIATQTAGALEKTSEFSVQLSAAVQENPARITLHWPKDSCSQPKSYSIHRKAPGASSWGRATTLPGTATQYIDKDVSVGASYEYQVVKDTPRYTGYGYIYSGINVPLTDSRGKLLLVVDNTYAAQLTNELARLQQDLVGDGWQIMRLDVARNDSAANVKRRIKAQYDSDPKNVKAVFLFGHVPVAYSGDIVPDGHCPDHRGAWPCDGFYGDMDGEWTDNTVNDTTAADARNRNVPGDGKYDQSSFPAPLKLMVGRVDLANMPGRLSYGGPATFPSELELLRNYLNKDHSFRQKQFDLPRRGVVGDYFGVRDGEAFAASGWRNLSTFFSAENVTTLPEQGTWIPTLSSNSYLWAYGCGPGSFTSIGGLGNTDSYHDGVTTELVKADVKAAFTLLFGSWLGDWDSEDNLQRAVLALPTYGLTCACSGRPHWFLQHMALGEPIGYGARLTQNNRPGGLYGNEQNNCASQIHIALMGDPTLRMHVVSPPANVTSTDDGKNVALNWTSSSEPVVGYHVYRAANPNGPFTRLTTSPVTSTSYTDRDACLASRCSYMVRAVKLETSASGTYYNASQGAFLTPIDTSAGSIAATGEASQRPTGRNNGKPKAEDLAPTKAVAPAGGETNTIRALTPTGATAVTNNTMWFDDNLPAGAVPMSNGGDSWTWVSSNPAPNTGARAHQSNIAAGLHEHFFAWASQTLKVISGDTLVAYVYLDPSNVPSEIMLSWYDSNWEHRAYWGADSIAYGAGGTTGHRYMGPLPPTGQWVRLEVPASQVGLEGSTVSAMSFSQFNGRATWDTVGKAAVVITNDPNSGGSTNSTSTNSSPTNTTLTNATIWVDDRLPNGAVPMSNGGDSWNWVNSNPAPFSGALAHQSSIAAGLHEHYFAWASQTLRVNSGDSMIAYVYLDPANLPSEIMLSWNDGTWEHRAYWGSDLISYGGASGTPGHRYMGPLPTAGQWVRLVVPASQVGLEGSTLSGMSCSQYNGRATWDSAGKAGVVITNNPTSGGSTNSTPTNPNPTNSTSGNATVTNATLWVDDSLPNGAVPYTGGGDTWNWVNSNPAPFSGALAHQSTIAAGLHEHYFAWATQTLSVNAGETLVSYVYLDPNNLPNEIMLSWNDGTWEHRAYWGSDLISYGGASGTPGHRYMGPLPAADRWVRLEVPASQVALEGSTVSAMSFSQYNGRATWDAAGKATIIVTNNPGSGGVTNSPGSGGVTNSPGSGGVTNSPGSGGVTNPPVIVSTNALPGASGVDYVNLALPQVGSNALHVLTPNVLELKLINTKQPDPAQVTQWNFVDGNGNFAAPSAGAFTVTANGQSIAVTGVGFKRRPIYAPFEMYDLRIDNSLYLQLASPISDNQSVEVKNPGGSLWSSSMKFVAMADPLRYSPAIHVNQEGYMPNYSKKAMVGYYLGNLGEMAVPSSGGFKIVDATTGVQVFQGTLNLRADVGFPSPAYQKVYEADFTSFNTPGQYRLVVPGMGASLPFLIDNGIAMNFARAYELGLYHQRCGTNTAMPYTRFTHGACHTAPASVPLPQSSYTFTWNTIAGYAQIHNPDNPVQTAPALTSPSAQLFPYVRQGPIEASGGHHDAGDYSKYTINCARLVHLLMFEVDSLAGVGDLDNMGIPESGDGISDILQEAKWEADYIAKLQDTDGGFYFLTYPVNREYEAFVTPDHGDPQVVWPKTTSVTAASVAALAQCASSPAFKQAYPAAAAQYLQKAQLGWQFLMNAINKYGKNGAYQKITHYSDNFADQDELAWAACEMYLATGDPTIHQKLLSWFDPSSPSTWFWGWWHMFECYGNAIRSYAFAARSGRVSASALDATFLAKCQNEIATAGDLALNWSQKSAYGTSLPDNTKNAQQPGWYFSADQAFDMAVAYQLNPKPDYITAMIANMNYEGGCNPVNVAYITGMGWKRQRDIVSQWHSVTPQTLPPSGIPEGNVTGSFTWLYPYGGSLENLCFPTDATGSPGYYPFYDRWGDSWNVNAEMVVLNQARGLGTLAFLAAQTSLKTQPWRAVSGQVNVPSGPAQVGSAVTLSLSAPGIDLSSARITWEAPGQEPTFGKTFVFVPQGNGNQTVQAEAQLPDGRRIFAIGTVAANAANVAWVDDSVPAGAMTSASGGDSWNWVSSNPSPFAGSYAHQSALASGLHEHYFQNASRTLSVGVGDTLYAYIYVDPANPPSEIMLSWNTGSSWEHRAYWGANLINYGLDSTPSRRYMGPLPATGQWVQLQVPASQVGLEGMTVSGMSFSLYNGQATWDAAGVTSQLTGATFQPTNSLQVAALNTSSGFKLSWASVPGHAYRIASKNALKDSSWTTMGSDITANSAATSWTDSTSGQANQRFYIVAQIN